MSKAKKISSLIPKIFKYSFMKKEDLQITHCYTYPNFRRMNLYSFALYIIQKETNRNKVHSQKLQITKSINHVKFYHQKIYIKSGQKKN